MRRSASEQLAQFVVAHRHHIAHAKLLVLERVGLEGDMLGIETAHAVASSLKLSLNVVEGLACVSPYSNWMIVGAFGEFSRSRAPSSTAASWPSTSILRKSGGVTPCATSVSIVVTSHTTVSTRPCSNQPSPNRGSIELVVPNSGLLVTVTCPGLSESPHVRSVNQSALKPRSRILAATFGRISKLVTCAAGSMSCTQTAYSPSCAPTSQTCRAMFGQLLAMHLRRNASPFRSKS